MAYVLGGANGEAFGFTTAIANFALEAMHESQGLVDYTRVVTPNQGDTYLVPNFAAITYQDYDPSNTPGTGAGGFGFGVAPAAVEQNPALTQGSIQATPAVAATAFDVFYSWTTSFELAATMGEELGGSYGEKVDQRVAASFLAFGDTAQAAAANTGNTTTVGADGFPVIVSLGSMELGPQGVAITNPSAFADNTVLGIVQKIKQNYTVAKLPGTPIVVLDSDGNDGVAGSSMLRALAELSGGAVTTVANSGGSAITSLGEELLATGQLTNLYGCRLIFSNFLLTQTVAVGGQRNVNNIASDVKVGAYFHETCIFTVIKEGLQVKMGEKPGGLQMWLTGLAYMGAGIADVRRGGGIAIAQA
tara:strand:- start:2867 stop:3949 length:1083 start_codon:yes stop_codon:yes gene_type:complete